MAKMETPKEATSDSKWAASVIIASEPAKYPQLIHMQRTRGTKREPRKGVVLQNCNKRRTWSLYVCWTHGHARDARESRHLRHRVHVHVHEHDARTFHLFLPSVDVRVRVHEHDAHTLHLFVPCGDVHVRVHAREKESSHLLGRHFVQQARAILGSTRPLKMALAVRTIEISSTTEAKRTDTTIEISVTAKAKRTMQFGSL